MAAFCLIRKLDVMSSVVMFQHLKVFTAKGKVLSKNFVAKKKTRTRGKVENLRKQ